MTITTHAPSLAEIPDDLLARWRRIPVSVLVDLAPDLQIDPAIRALRPAGSEPLFGRALTVRCAPPDFGSVLLATGAIRAGEVMVIDAGGAAHAAVIGDVLCGQLARVGAAGVVCDGAVRDVDGLAAMTALPVYARFVNPRGPVGVTEGEMNGPVTVGGCRVGPGDLVIGDGDGLAAVPAERLADLIGPAEKKLALEAEWTARMTAGEGVAAIFGLE